MKKSPRKSAAKSKKAARPKTAAKQVATVTSLVSERDVAFMRRALELAEQHRGLTTPNPLVGCVIVAFDGEVLAEGAHRAAGQPHAEADALAKLKGRAKGATMYVNLEPCTHQGRTPPCAPAVIASGVKRVVIGSEDPVPGHGGGIAALRAAGITVDRALVAECDAANRPFFTWARERRPSFTLKAAISLDGKIQTVSGESQWITGEAAREDGRRLRATHDAILVGIGTVLADDPQLTTRIKGMRDPIRIVVDSKLRTPAAARVLDLDKAGRARRIPHAGDPDAFTLATRTILATTTTTREFLDATALDETEVEIRAFDADRDGRVPLVDLARELGKLRIQSVLVEGGGEIHASLLAADLADELVLYVAPKIIGGPAKSWVGGEGIDKLDLAHQFQIVDTVRIGEDLRIRAVRRR